MPGNGKTFEAFQQDAAAVPAVRAGVDRRTECRPARERPRGGHRRRRLGVGRCDRRDHRLGDESGRPRRRDRRRRGVVVRRAFSGEPVERVVVAAAAKYDGAYMQCMYAHGNQVPVRMSYRGARDPRRRACIRRRTRRRLIRRPTRRRRRIPPPDALPPPVANGSSVSRRSPVLAGRRGSRPSATARPSPAGCTCWSRGTPGCRRRRSPARPPARARNCGACSRRDR